MTIAFNQIPVNIRTPGQYLEFDNSKAINGLVSTPHKMLVIGQRVAAGQVLANVPTRIYSGDQARVNFGNGSMLAAMCFAARNANPNTEIWAVALDDVGAGVAATGTITLTGAPTANGTLYVYLGGVRIPVSVTVGQSLTVIAGNVVAAINNVISLQATATNSAGVITVTYRHKGECGNFFDIRLNYGFNETTPIGLTVAIAAMSGGTSNPDVATAIAAVAGSWFQTWVNPYTDSANLGKLETELSARFGPLVQMEGHIFSAASGSLATLTTLGGARNSPHLTILGTGKCPTQPFIMAAIAAAVDAAEPDPARPRQTLALPGALAPLMQEAFSRADRDALLQSGISTFNADDAGNVTVDRLITTYKTNALGFTDTSYLNVETMRTLGYLRYSLRARIGQKFPRHKLANDGTQFAPGQAVVTPILIRMEILHLFREWELAGLAEDFEQFNRDLIVERNSSDQDRIDAVIPPNTVNQFRVFAGAVQFRL